MPSAHIVVGLGWGDEGKGATVDALASRYGADRVVRFNGGQQAAHNVVVNGVHHTFQSYGSATMMGVPTYISSHCTIEPVAARREKLALVELGLRPDPIKVDSNALVTTALHVYANLEREKARGGGKHGSTGRGFGETISYGLDYPDDAPRARDLLDLGTLMEKYRKLFRHYVEEGLISNGSFVQFLKVAARQYLSAKATFKVIDTDQFLDEISQGHTIFEGAQGFWLDENFGFQPHTTWSTTTPANARSIARQAGISDVTTVGALRTYATRHGAGPMPGEGSLRGRPAEPHNSDEANAGYFRVGLHDPDLMTAAIRITMPDFLSVSHLDEFEEFQTTEGRMPLDVMTPVLITAEGPDRLDRHFSS